MYKTETPCALAVRFDAAISLVADAFDKFVRWEIDAHRHLGREQPKVHGPKVEDRQPKVYGPSQKLAQQRAQRQQQQQRAAEGVFNEPNESPDTSTGSGDPSSADTSRDEDDYECDASRDDTSTSSHSGSDNDNDGDDAIERELAEANAELSAYQRRDKSTRHKDKRAVHRFEPNVDLTSRHRKRLRAVENDVRSIHFAVLLHGREPVGPVVNNARNVHGSHAGPFWTHTLYDDDERSVHAEARAAQRATIRSRATTKRARRNQDRSGVGTADGVLVCRVTRSGALSNSCPCRDCVETLYRAGLRFVVYSCDDGTWVKKSLSALYHSDAEITGVAKALTVARAERGRTAD